MFRYKKDFENLRNENLRLIDDLDHLKNQNSDLIEENKNLEEKIKELKISLNDEEYKNLSSEKNIQRAINEKELLEMKYDDIQGVLEEYRQLPDLKNMIDNLSSLTAPSIDKLIDLVKNTDFKELTNFNERISSIEQKLDTLIDLFRGRRF